MKFVIGSIVFCKQINKCGVLLSIQGQQARVQVENLVINCLVAHLDPATNQLTSNNINKNSKKNSSQVIKFKKSKVAESLDLHGLTCTEAISALEQYFSDVIVADLRSVDIIHGLGSGRLKSTVEKYLQTAPFVSKYALLEFNRGTTRVYLKKL